MNNEKRNKYHRYINIHVYLYTWGKYLTVAEYSKAILYNVYFY